MTFSIFLFLSIVSLSTSARLHVVLASNIEILVVKMRKEKGFQSKCAQADKDPRSKCHVKEASVRLGRQGIGQRFVHVWYLFILSTCDYGVFDCSSICKTFFIS